MGSLWTLAATGAGMHFNGRFAQPYCMPCSALQALLSNQSPEPAGNPCFVYLSKRARDDPETLDEALALCRAAKRPCRSRGNAGSDSEVRLGRLDAAACCLLAS